MTIPTRKTKVESPTEPRLIQEDVGYLPPAKYSISDQAKQDASSLALRSSEVVSIVDKSSNDAAGVVVRDIRKYCKEVETMRTALTKPLLEGQRLLKSLADEHTAPLLAEVKRIERMGTAFLESEQKRIANEERKRREEFEAAQRKQFEAADALRAAEESGKRLATFEAKKDLEAAKAETMAVISAPEPEAIRAKGQSMKQVLKWEVTDIYALVKARPDLCNIEAKASAINASCNPQFPIPGLKLWYENKSTFLTR